MGLGFFMKIFSLNAILMTLCIGSLGIGIHANSIDLFVITKQQSCATLKKMFKKYKNLNVINEYGDSLLSNAVVNNDYKMVKALLKSGKVHVNQMVQDNKTALDLAVEYGYTKIALLLAKYGGKITREDNLYHFKSVILRKSIGSIVKFFLLAALGIGLVCVTVFVWFPAALAGDVTLFFVSLSLPVAVEAYALVHLGKFAAYSIRSGRDYYLYA